MNSLLSLIAGTVYIVSCALLSSKEEHTPQRFTAFYNSFANFVFVVGIMYTGWVPEIPTSSDYFIPFISWVFMSEILFTCSHRLFHTRWLYWMHKQHHKNNPSYSTSSFDAHPFEFLFGNLLTAALPMYIVPGSAFIQIFWTVFAVANTVWSHHMEGSHMKHHTSFKYNYGQGFYTLDRIFGTFV